MATKFRTAVPTLGILGLAIASPALHNRTRLQCQPNLNTSPSWNNEPSSGLNPFKWLLGRAQPAPAPPPPTASQTTLNPIHYRQISSGSFSGLLAGMIAVKFSRTLAVVIGIFFLIIELLAAKGVHIIPYQRINRWVKEADYRSFMFDNMAFKIAFGAAFAAAACL